jgi:hypothetical protein
MEETVKKTFTFFQNQRKFERYFLPNLEKAANKFSKAGEIPCPKPTATVAPRLF